MAHADKVFPIFGAFFGEIRPAASMLGVTALYKPEMKIEIEVTAKRRS
jgi:enamine deaminase RidA (YjgF/YER057c/UK114 family)